MAEIPDLCPEHGEYLLAPASWEENTQNVPLGISPDHRKAQAYFCCSQNCPGLPYRASERQHPCFPFAGTDRKESAPVGPFPVELAFGSPEAVAQAAETLTVKQVQHADDGSWSVYANGKLVIERESYQIASNIAYALEHPEIEDHSECGEVARLLLKALAR